MTPWNLYTRDDQHCEAFLRACRGKWLRVAEHDDPLAEYTFECLRCRKRVRIDPLVLTTSSLGHLFRCSCDEAIADDARAYWWPWSELWSVA